MHIQMKLFIRKIDISHFFLNSKFERVLNSKIKIVEVCSNYKM